MISSDANILSGKTFGVFPDAKNAARLPDLCEQLLADQKTKWGQLADGYASFDAVQTREVDCGDFVVTLQFNPIRITSTGANVDPDAVRKRSCFLCLAHLPTEQQGILVHEKFLILCNPMPMFPQHFTVASTDHIPQELGASSFTVMLDLAKEISPEFTIFYNGPRCGASAPDHLHFQLCSRRAMPVENDAVDMRRRKKFYYEQHVAGFTMEQYGRAVLIIESTEKERLQDFFFQIIGEWKNLLRCSDEPMMNMLCSFQQELWRLILFPRRKHRPDIYHRQGNEGVVISPAAVDMGGLLVTPVEKDFQWTGASLIKQIFLEVGETQETVHALIGRFS